MKKSSKRKRKARPAELSTDLLTKQAEEQFAGARYKDAMQSYKLLIGRERRPEWIVALRHAYLARAEELAAKDMIKEASALWESMAHLCQSQDGLDRYLHWLLQSGRYERAARVLSDASNEFQDSAAGRDVAACLGVLLLGGKTELKGALPSDAQLDSAAAALRAYCAGDDEEMAAYLKRLPYRSPYRDLRPIFQALVKTQTCGGEAGTQLKKLSTDSIFTPLSTLIGALDLPEDRLLNQMRGLKPEEFQLFAALRGWDSTQIELLQKVLELKSSKEGVSLKALFRVLADYRQVIGEAHAQRMALALLNAYPDGIKAYDPVFKTLTVPHRLRIGALRNEQNDDPEEAVDLWYRCVDSLQQEPESEHNRLASALILRHVAKLKRAFMAPFEWMDEGLNDLGRSLEFDPTDKDTYLEMVQILEHHGREKERDRWLERAVKHLPEESDIILAAANAAYRRGAFKKAANYVDALLARDPINRQARGLLISCHLAHGRKQAVAGKFRHAVKELDIAMRHAKDEIQQGSVELTRGLVALAAGEEGKAAQWLEQGYQHSGGSAAADLRIIVDGRRIGISNKKLQPQLEMCRTKGRQDFDRADIFNFTDLLLRYRFEGVRFLTEIVTSLQKPLRKAAAFDYSLQELQSICEAFAEIDAYLPLGAYADKALAQAPGIPAFVYFDVVAKNRGRRRISNSDRGRLLDAYERAENEGDFATMERIDQLFESSGSFGAMGPVSGFPPDLGSVLGEALESMSEAEFAELAAKVFGDDLEQLFEPLPVPQRKREKKAHRPADDSGSEPPRQDELF